MYRPHALQQDTVPFSEKDFSSLLSYEGPIVVVQDLLFDGKPMQYLRGGVLTYAGFRSRDIMLQTRQYGKKNQAGHEWNIGGKWKESASGIIILEDELIGAKVMLPSDFFPPHHSIAKAALDIRRKEDAESLLEKFR